MRIYSEGQWWLAILVMIIVLIGPGRIEGRIMPAANPMTVDIAVQVVNSNNKTVRYWGNSERLRAECSFRRIDFFLGQRGKQNVPLISRLGPPKIRANEKFDFGPWELFDLSRDDFLNNTFANVYHQCRVFGQYLPWLIVSPFWR